jgi:hypothetical protein
VASIPLLILAFASAAQPTDFGIRSVHGQRPPALPKLVAASRRIADSPPAGRTFDLQLAVRAASSWGLVTSTKRSVQRNRAVGGAVNSYHLSGRAIDVARRAGVRHLDVELAFRKAGFDLIESIDEGDHSHFAFRTALGSVREPRLPEGSWRIVYAPKPSPASQPDAS